MYPLEGLRILAVEQYGAGPIGSSYLVSLGAEVIKIESPQHGGDVSRGVGPHFISGDGESDDSLFYQGLNFDKKSIAIDLNDHRGREIFTRLVESADAILTNLRGDVPQKLGLTYEQLKPHNPKIVCAHLTGYGRDNKRANWPGYDYMMQAEAGYFYLTGEPDAPPTRFGLSMIDFTTGVTVALALVSAVQGATKSGKGRDVDVSLFDVAMYNLNYLATWSLNASANQERAPRSAHFALTPCQLYRTGDGWIYVMCNKEKFWHNLCDKLGRRDLLEDDRFADYASRLANRDALTEILDEAFSKSSTQAWLDKFAASVPAAPVLNLREAIENPFLDENGGITTTQAGRRRGIRSLRNPIRFSEGARAQRSAPTLGEHTKEILLDAGVDPDELESLEEDGVISTAK